MRRFPGFAAFLVLVVLAACARSSSDIDKMQPGTALTVSMKDGSTLSGRLVQVKPDSLVIDPAEGGEWKTVSRDQIASVTTQQAAAAPAVQPPPEAAQQPPPEAAPPPPAASEPSHAAPPRRAAPSPRASAAVPPANAAAAPAPAPSFRELTIPEGTVLHAKLENAVASDTSKVEDPVQASLTQPVLVDGVEAVAQGSTLKGVVTKAQPSGKVKGVAELAFRFDTLSAGADEHRIHTGSVALAAESTKKKDALKIGVGAGAGAIIGGIVGGGKGAAIGTAVGGGAGTATVLATKGDEVRLGPGAAVTVKLASPLTVRVPIDR